MILLFAAGLEIAYGVVVSQPARCQSRPASSPDIGATRDYYCPSWLPFAGQQLPACAVFSSNPPEPDVSASLTAAVT